MYVYQPFMRTQSFLFLPQDMEGVFRLAGPKQNRYRGCSLHNPLKAKIRFFDTPTGQFRENDTELTQRLTSLPGFLSNGCEIHAYNRNNRWQTQSRELIRPSGEPATQLPHATDMLEVEEKFAEYLLCTDQELDIAVQKISYPEANIEYVAFMHTTAGINFPHDNYSPDSVQAFECRNCLGMMAFLDEAVNAGFIVPLNETPHTLLIAAQQNRLQS